MAIRLNTQILSKKITQFDSPRVDGLKMINTKYYDKSPLNPVIEAHQIISKNGVNTEFSTKTFQNGDKFEVYKTPEEVIKLIKNRFGEIKAFKSNIESHNQSPAKIYENMKDSFANKTRSFLA